jgi:sugar lactone lactonase YvrE
VADFGGRYRRVKLLGAGGMGEVWLALDEELGDRPVAIKVMQSRMLASAEDVARFQREMRLASWMQHPNIMTVFTTGTDSGIPFMVMEYLQGRDLSKAPPNRDPGHVARIGRDTCAALAYAHGQGVVHRDIKPGNLFLCDTGPVKVTDFGIAKAVSGTRLSATGTLIGTFPFMAPEQWLGEPAAFSNDIWAVGCVLYELLSGRLPREYGTPTEYVAAAARHQPVPPLPTAVSMPAWLADAVMAMLQEDPRRRPTAGECLQILSEPLEQSSPQPAPRPAPSTAAAAPAIPQTSRSRYGQSSHPPQPAPRPAAVPAPAPGPAPASRTMRPARSWRRLITAAAVAAAVIWTAATYAPGWLSSGPAWVPGTGTLYVIDSAGMSSVDLKTGNVHELINGTFGDNTIFTPVRLAGIALSPRGDTAYVAENYNVSAGACACLLPVNLATGASGKATAIDASAPAAGDTQVVLSRDGKTAYVVSGSGVVPVNVAAGTKGTTIPAGNASSLIAISSDGRFLYVTTDRNRDLVRVSLASGSSDAPISVGSTIGAIAAGPDGMVYAYDNAGISAINATAGRIASTLRATWHEDDTYGPSAMAITPDGTTAYVNATDGVIPLSLRTMQAAKLIDVAQASGVRTDHVTVSAIVASPDDKGVYVGTTDGSVYPVSRASNQVGKPWDMRKSYIYSMAVTR